MKANKGSRTLSALSISLSLLFAAGITGCIAPQDTPQDPAPTHTGSKGASATTEAADSVVVANLAAEEVQTAFNFVDAPGQGLTTTTVIPCTSGNITVEITVGDPLKRSAGDSYKTTYNACVRFGRTIDGVSTFTIDTLTGVAFSPPPAVWSIKTTADSLLTITSATGTSTQKSNFIFTNGTPDAGIAGSGVIYTRAVNGSSESTVVRNGVTTTHTHTVATSFETNFSTSTPTYTHIMNVTTTGARALKIETLAPLVGTRGSVPDSGAIKITRTTAGVTSITTLTAVGGGNVRIDVDSNGDGTIDSTSTVPWPVGLIGTLL